MNDNVKTFYTIVNRLGKLFFSVAKIKLNRTQPNLVMPELTTAPQTSRLRRENLLRLLREFTEQQLALGVTAKGIELAFAAHLSISPSTLSQLKSSRNMGDKIAAQIEQHSGKAPGWLDAEHVGAMSTPGESAFIELTRLAWRATDAKGRRTLMRLAKSRFSDILKV